MKLFGLARISRGPDRPLRPSATIALALCALNVAETRSAQLRQHHLRRRCGGCWRSRARDYRARLRATGRYPAQTPSSQGPIDPEYYSAASAAGAASSSSTASGSAPKSCSSGTLMAATSTSGSLTRVQPEGRTTSLARICAPASSPVDIHLEPLRNADGEGLDEQRLRVQVHFEARRRFADDMDRDVDLHLFARLDDDEVEVLDDLTHGVLLHILHQGQLASCPRCRASRIAFALRRISADLVARQG